MIILLLRNHCVQGVRGNVPIFKKLWQIRSHATFFSVLRLCGSRQVVAQCCADERIIQMHILCPSLESRKWSADLYAVQIRSHATSNRITIW